MTAQDNDPVLPSGPRVGTGAWLREVLEERFPVAAAREGDDAERRVELVARALAVGLGEGHGSTPESAQSYVAMQAKREGKGASTARQKTHAVGSWGRWTLQGIIIATLLGAVLVIREIQPGRSRMSDHPGHVYTTENGQTAVVTLVDGSRVILAPRTMLTVADAFGTFRRTLVLRGQAHFRVSAAAGVPFTVYTTTGASARVLGTTFDIRAYPGQPDVRIAVQTGRVQARAANGARVTVVAGAVAQVTDSTVVAKVADVTSYTSWADGTLVFDKTPVPEVLATLSQWYGIQFRLADATLARVPLTAHFSTQSSRDAMDLLKTVLHVTLTFDHVGDTTIVILHARPSHDPGSRTDSVRLLRDMQNSFSLHQEVGR